MDFCAASDISRDAPVRTLQSSAEAGCSIRIASLNLFFGNRRHARVLDFIYSTQADVLVLMEVTERWRRALSPLLRHYPHTHMASDVARRGVVLLSRSSISELEVLRFDERSVPALAATLAVPGHLLRIVAVHATWPIGLRNWRMRNRQLLHLAQFVRSSAMPQLVIGDLNITARSASFRSLLEEGGLRSAASGWGWQPTWPTFLLPLGLQIDHCLVSPAIRVRNFRRGVAVGSDHRPIIVELDLLPKVEVLAPAPVCSHEQADLHER